MAADNPTAATGAEGGAEAAPPQKSGGIKSFLPLLIGLIAIPAVVYATLEVKSRMDKKSAGAPPSPEHKEESSHSAAPAAAEHSSSGSSHDSGKSKSAKSGGDKRNVNLSVPLTRQLVKYAGPAKEEDVEKIVTLDVKGEMKDIAESDKIVVNIANTGGSRYAVGRFSVLGDHPDLIARMNEHRIKLIAAVQGTLSSETLEDFQRPGFKNLLASALVSQFNAILGSGSVKEVIIEELVIQ